MKFPFDRLAACALLAMTSGAGPVAASEDPCRAASPASEVRHLLVVSGLGGEVFYRDRFASWAAEFDRLFDTVLPELGSTPAHPDEVTHGV